MHGTSKGTGSRRSAVSNWFEGIHRRSDHAIHHGRNLGDFLSNGFGKIFLQAGHDEVSKDLTEGHFEYVALVLLIQDVEIVGVVKRTG